MSQKVVLTIRATNGATWDTEDFGLNQKVDVVRKKATAHFVKTGEMADGDYILNLVQGGQAIPLADAATLSESGVTEGAVLALTVRGPQVDG